jgi:hypothetical protein
MRAHTPAPRVTQTMPFLRSLLIAIALLASVTQSGSAQTIRGELRDAERGRLIPGARLVLVTSSALAVDSTTSDEGGRFQLTAPDAGIYAINFELDGWAGILSDTLHLTSRTARSYTFRVRLVSNDALQHIASILDMEARLQGSLTQICGEPFRGWEAGLLIGVVRDRASQRPIARARVSVAAGGAAARTTLSGDNGVFVLCNVPTGNAVAIVATTTNGVKQTYTLEIRAGNARWYDLLIDPAR